MHKPVSVVLLILLSAAILLLTSCSYTPILSQSAIGQSRNQTASTAETETAELVIWAAGSPENHWRVDGLLKAVDQVTQINITTTGVYYANGDNYKEEFVAAAEAGKAPDIAVVDQVGMRLWAQAGYLAPFDACRSKYSEFDDVVDSLWNVAAWRDQIWGVPLEVWPAPLFFNKLKLKEMGWSEAKIAALPDKIKQGEFTQDDLLATAKAAMAKGVIERGFGYWYRPSMNLYLIHPYQAYGGHVYDPTRDKLVIERKALVQWYTFQRQLVTEGVTPDRLFNGTWQVGATGRGIYHDTVAHGRVLFWSGTTSFWGGWARQYTANLAGDDSSPGAGRLFGQGVG